MNRVSSFVRKMMDRFTGKSIPVTPVTFNISAPSPNAVKRKVRMWGRKKNRPFRRRRSSPGSFGTFRPIRPFRARTDWSKSAQTCIDRASGKLPSRKLWRKMMRIRDRRAA